MGGLEFDRNIRKIDKVRKGYLETLGEVFYSLKLFKGGVILSFCYFSVFSESFSHNFQAIKHKVYPLGSVKGLLSNESSRVI